jgi:membrane associated rhomboid family serine protease
VIPLRGSIRSPVVPLVTVVLIAANLAAFVYELSLADEQLNALITRWGVVPVRQTWALDEAPLAIDLWLMPVFSSMFLHGGWSHLIGNMLFLWVFGDGVEHRLGSLRFLGFYALCGFFAAQAQAWLDPTSAIPMIGASGAVAGVLGAYLLLFPLAQITVLFPVVFIPLFFKVPALVFLGLWFLEQFYLGSVAALTPTAGAAAGVAWFAHIGGFAGGAVFVLLLRPAESARRRLADGHW